MLYFICGSHSGILSVKNQKKVCLRKVLTKRSNVLCVTFFLRKSEIMLPF